VSRKFSGDIEDARDRREKKSSAQLAQHLTKTRTPRWGSDLVDPRALARHGVIGAEDERHGVDEERRGLAESLSFLGLRDSGECAAGSDTGDFFREGKQIV